LRSRSGLASSVLEIEHAGRIRSAVSVVSSATSSTTGRVGWRLSVRPEWLPFPLGAALFGLALALRVWGLTQSVTADDQDWIGRSADFSRAVQKGTLRDTYQSAHPGVPIMWVAYLVVTPDQLAVLTRYDNDNSRLVKSSAYLPALFNVRRALAGYAATLTVVLAFLTWRLFGVGPGILAGLLLAAEPFLVAHGQLFSTDTMLALLMAISVLSAVVYFDGRGDRLYLLGSGLAAGLAFSTKAPAILLFGFVPLLGLLWTVRRDQADRGRWEWRSIPRLVLRGPGATLLRDLLLWGGVAGLIYVLAWPSLWVDPVGTMLRLERGVRGIGESPRRWGNFFLGQSYSDEDVALLLRPVFYPIVTALRLSPITCVGLLALATLALARRWRARLGFRDLDRRVLALVGYVVLYTAMMTLSPKKLDRYLLPVYPALVILAALGLWWAVRRWLPLRWQWPAVAALGLGQVALVVSVEPYPLSFYNPLLGGAPVARQVMIVGWGEGLDQVATYLNQQSDADAVVAVSLYKDQLVPWLRGNGVRLEDWRKANYLVNYVNMEQRNLIPAPLQELVRTTTPDFTASINGIAYAQVYRIPTEIREQSGRERGPRPNDVPHP
jgi:4-amino-4-deoxy-L-arabinose transferase-like glycosyltransferase